MFAVIETGNKQYKVGVGDKIRIEKLTADRNKKVIFDKVLLRSDRGQIAIGQPHISGSEIEADILDRGRSDKKIVFRYHSKTRYRKKKGARQAFTEVKILKIK